jgi:hypothetical protein
MNRVIAVAVRNIKNVAVLKLLACQNSDNIPPQILSLFTNKPVKPPFFRWQVVIESIRAW